MGFTRLIAPDQVGSRSNGQALALAGPAVPLIHPAVQLAPKFAIDRIAAIRRRIKGLKYVPTPGTVLTHTVPSKDTMNAATCGTPNPVLASPLVDKIGIDEVSRDLRQQAVSLVANPNADSSRGRRARIFDHLLTLIGFDPNFTPFGHCVAGVGDRIQDCRVELRSVAPSFAQIWRKTEGDSDSRTSADERLHGPHSEPHPPSGDCRDTVRRDLSTKGLDVIELRRDGRMVFERLHDVPRDIASAECLFPWHIKYRYTIEILLSHCQIRL